MDNEMIKRLYSALGNPGNEPDPIKRVISALTPADLAALVPGSSAMLDVSRERRRQIEVEGWGESHDDNHNAGELVAAACTYALEATLDGPKARGVWFHRLWPWDLKWWKPKDKRRDLVRAAALLVAEIERLDRSAAPAPGGE
jgi:hypothetical protein